MLRAPRIHGTRAGLLAAGGLLTSAVLLPGCGTPPELREPQAAPTSARPVPVIPTVAAPLPVPSTSTPAPTTAAPSDLAAMPCRGGPTGAQVVALLRKPPIGLPKQAHATVTVGPLCADGWQYTIVEVPDHEPLEVVSKGRPSALSLVTAGTDVCNIPVRTEAPPGIQSAACSEGLVPGAGA